MSKRKPRTVDDLLGENESLCARVAELLSAESLRLQTDRALRETEEFNAALLHNAPNPIVVINPDGSIRYVNPALERLTGFASGEVGGVKPPYPWWTPETLEKTRYDLDRAMREGAVRLEELFQTKDGQRFRVEITSVAVKAHGGLRYYLANWVDITDRMQAAEALRQERDFARNLLETARVIVVVLDNRGRVVLFNPFAQELTGYTEDEVKGADWFETFLPKAERPRIADVFHRILDGESATGVVNPIVARDGREILVRWYNSVLRDADGNVTGVLSLGHDITEIRQREEQLRQAAKMEALGRLAGGVAHDFNNMLAIIQGYADLLARSAPSEEYREDLRRIRSAAARAADLTSKLLAFGRRGVAEPRALRLSDVLDELQPMLSQAMGQSVELVISISPGLWPIKADRSLIEQAILNLAVNARQAMPDGGRLAIEAANVAPRSRTRARPDDAPPGQYVLLTVSDTGVGMSAEVTRHLFEPYYTTRKGQGMGLGLASTYGIVTQGHGHIAVDSAPGAGATFRIYLPRTDESPREPAEAMPLPSGAEDLPKGTETILVAEDEEDVRGLIVRILRNCGYTVLETGSAREALPLGEHYDGTIHLLITDVVMPTVSGRDLARRLRRVRRRLKVLYVSAYADPAPAGRDRLRRGVNFLTKPFSAQEMAEIVRRILGRPKKRRTRKKPDKGPRADG